jgi:hypothetical protein
MLKFMKLSFQRTIICTKRVPNKRVVPILLRRCNLSKADFRLRSSQWFFHISLYGSSKLMILDALEEGFKELLNIKFSSIVHLWICAQILMETATPLSSLVDD